MLLFCRHFQIRARDATAHNEAVYRALSLPMASGSWGGNQQVRAITIIGPA